MKPWLFRGSQIVLSRYKFFVSMVAPLKWIYQLEKLLSETSNIAQIQEKSFQIASAFRIFWPSP